MDCTKLNERPNSLHSPLIIVLQSSSTTECTSSVISWFLLMEGLPEHSSLLTDIRPFLFEPPKPLLNLRTPYCLLPKSLLNCIRFLSMSAQVLSKLSTCAAQLCQSSSVRHTHNMHNRFWLIASNCSIRVRGSKSGMFTEVQGCMHPTLIPKCHLVDKKKKKNMVRYFLIRPHTSNHLELKKHVLFYCSRTTEIFPRKQFAA